MFVFNFHSLYCLGAKVYRDSTRLSSGFTFEGRKCEVGKISFDIETELLNFKSAYGDLSVFWGEHDGQDVQGPTGNAPASRTRWYRNCIILMIPYQRKFPLLCKNSLQESLDYLYKNFESRQDRVEGGGNSETRVGVIPTHSRVERGGIAPRGSELRSPYPTRSERAYFVCEILFQYSPHYERRGKAAFFVEKEIPGATTVDLTGEREKVH